MKYTVSWQKRFWMQGASCIYVPSDTFGVTIHLFIFWILQFHNARLGSTNFTAYVFYDSNNSGRRPIICYMIFSSNFL